MNVAVIAPRMVIRIAGVILIILGALFWTGTATGLIPLHMLLGIILVLALWVLAVVAARAGVSTGIVVLAIVWGVLVLALGLVQGGLLPGPVHWLVQVAHLLVGLVAIGLGEVLGGRVKSLSRATMRS
jgi:hypothetical protein